MIRKPLIKVVISCSGISKLKRRKKDAMTENAIIVRSMEKIIHFGAFDSKFKYVLKPEI